MLIKQKEFIKLEKNFKNWNIWQSFNWWNFQANLWKKVFSISWDSYLALIIKQNLPFKQNYLQVSRWPLWWADDEFFEDVSMLANKEKSFFVRVIPEIEYFYEWLSFNVYKNNFPSISLVIDLTKSEEEILIQMKQKGRYNIRLAQKKWVQIIEEKDSEKSSKIFFDLMKDTWKRDWFVWHSKEFYKTMIDSLWDNIKVLIAYFDNKPISAWIFTFCSTKAVYYYWASSNKYRNLMAPYYVQWDAICLAKKMWCKSYDFLWIAEDVNNEKDPLYWVTQFKLKFWWEIIKYPASIDIPISLWKYVIYRIVQFLR